MAHSEILAQRVRDAVANLPSVEEKRMFGGIAFIINGKMCITVGKDRLMFRINPLIHEFALKKKGTSTVFMRGHEYKGYVHVNEEGLSSGSDFDYWIGLALKFNKDLKVAKKRK